MFLLASRKAPSSLRRTPICRSPAPQSEGQSPVRTQSASIITPSNLAFSSPSRFQLRAWLPSEYLPWASAGDAPAARALSERATAAIVVRFIAHVIFGTSLFRVREGKGRRHAEVLVAEVHDALVRHDLLDH